MSQLHAIQVTLKRRVYELFSEHGSMRLAAKAVGLDHAYLYRLCAGTKENPSDETLGKLSLRKVVIYERMIHGASN